MNTNRSSGCDRRGPISRSPRTSRRRPSSGAPRTAVPELFGWLAEHGVEPAEEGDYTEWETELALPDYGVTARSM